MIVRCVSLGGKVVESEFVQFQDAAIVVRWPNFAGLREFALAHGAQIVPLSVDWKWRLHEDDLATLREQATEAKIKFRVSPPPESSGAKAARKGGATLTSANEPVRGEG